MSIYDYIYFLTLKENVPAYDPWKSTEKREIIRCLIGGSKTTKMKFKLAERQRIMNLQKENSCNLNLKNNFVRFHI